MKKYIVLVISMIFVISLATAQNVDKVNVKEWLKNFNKTKPKDNDSLIVFTLDKLKYLNLINTGNLEEEKSKDKAFGVLYGTLGPAYRVKNNNYAALDACEKALKYLNSCGCSDSELAKNYFNAAPIYRLQKDFEKAKQYFEQAIILYQQANNSSGVFQSYSELINSYLLEGFSPNDNIIQNLYNKANIIPNVKKWEKAISELNVFGEHYGKMKNYNKAIVVYDKAIEVFKNEEIEYKKTKNRYAKLMRRYQVEAINYKTKALIESGRYSEAKKDFELIDNLLEADSVNLNLHHLKAHLLSTWVQYHIAQSQYPKAQQYHQQILQFINPLFTYQTIYQNPSPNQIIGNPYLLTTLADKAEIFKKIHAQTNNKINLTHALNCYELSYTAADQMRKEYSFKEANTYLSDYTYSYFEKAIELCQQLIKANPNQTQKYQNKAFEIAQRSSMKTLFWKLNSKVATKFLSKEDSTEIEQLRDQLAKAKQSIIDTVNREKKQNDLFEARQNYEKAEKRMEAKYPEYAKLKFENQLVSVDTLQQNRLNKDEALLNYFVGDSSITCFVVTQTSFRIVEIKEVDIVMDNIKLWRESIQKKKTSDSLAAKLYQQLLSEALSNLSQNFNTLIINGDAALAGIPFEALKEHADERDYLLHSYNVSYTLHPHFIKKRPQKNFIDKLESHRLNPFREQKKFKGFTADYSNRAGLSSLPFAKREMENIQKITGGSVYPLATKKLVIEQLKDSEVEIIHFATHAVGDSLETANSKIFLTPYADVNISSQDDLYLDDILNLNCTADLVVLSACQTGLGVYNRGEGISSLARAFRTIGSKSLVMSLWKANDLTTASIMENFYQHLENGELKSEALRQAKIDFLNSDKFENHQKDPYYWAAFLLQGEPDALY